MTQNLPEDVQEPLREQIIQGLGKTCSLMPNSAYAKFNDKWDMTWWRNGEEVKAGWWVTYELDDFGHVTRGGIGENATAPDNSTRITGVIEEVPPDRFRRETDQPIPKPVELKNPEPEKSSFSRSVRGSGKRREV